MSEVTRVVNSLYETFARYPRPVAIEFCPCGCTKADATQHLVAVPLRELRVEDLEDYFFSAIMTQGTVDDFRYLLPRLFQIMAEEPLPCNPEIVFGKLRYAKWMSWPEDEVNAIRTYMDALWRAALKSFPISLCLPAFFEIETLITSIAITGESLEPYLKVWSETATVEADEHLIQMVTMYGNEFSKGGTLHGGFWTDQQLQAKILREWLLRPETLRRLTKAAGLLRSDGFEHLFEPAFETLQHESRLSSSGGIPISR
jgi:hypothetical protein